MARKDDNIRIRCTEETKREWGQLCAKIDPNADYAEIVETLAYFFDTNPDQLRKLRRMDSPPAEYR